MVQSLDISTVRECMEYPEPFDFEKGEPLMPKPDAEYEIRLENVSFCYPESKTMILENINLTLHPGEKLAVVGPKRSPLPAVCTRMRHLSF